MKVKCRAGDLIEIKTAKGLAYVQYTHDGESHGQLIRVLPGLFDVRPETFQGIAEQKELYFIFFTLEYALRNKQVEVVSHQSIPDWARHFPIMRKGGAWSDQKEESLNWHIGNGLRLDRLEDMRNSEFVRELSSEQKKISIAQLCSFPALVGLIERGWTPERDDELIAAARRPKKKPATERDDEFEDADRKKAAARKAICGSVRQMEAQCIDHYLYFPQRNNAEKAAERLRSKGWTVDVRMGADGRNWLALAKQPAPIDQDIGDLRDELEELANELGGEYDGWGSAI